MRDADWSRPNLLRSDWLGPQVAICTTDEREIREFCLSALVRCRGP